MSQTTLNLWYARIAEKARTVGWDDPDVRAYLYSLWREEETEGAYAQIPTVLELFHADERRGEAP